MVHRTYKTSSHWASFHNSIVKLKNSFSNNGYPNCLFDRILSKYMSKRNITAMHNYDTIANLYPTCIKYTIKLVLERHTKPMNEPYYKS